MNLRAFSFILLVLVMLSSCRSPSTTWNPTGVGDIDQIRIEILESPTDTLNALERRASLYRWWRFLWRQGYDMRSFDSIANLLVNYPGTESEALEAITDGYRILEDLYAGTEFIPEINGTPGESGSRTDWPFYHGTDGSQRGFSPDAGPSEGALAWRFPKGISWYASPVVDNGKIYVSSPGIDVYGYCLDERSGKIPWKGRQFGIQYYSNYGSACIDNTLFFGNCDGYMFGVDAQSGKKLWEYNTALNTPHEGRPLDGTFIHGFPPGVYCNPASDTDRFYSGSWSGYYYCFDKDGNLIWRTQTNNGNIHGGLPDSSAPVLWNGHLYVQKIGHYLSAINKNTGIINWEWTGVPGFLQNGTIAAHKDMVFGSVARRVTQLPYHAKMFAFSDVNNGGEIQWTYRGGGGLTTPVVTEENSSSAPQQMYS